MKLELSVQRAVAGAGPDDETLRSYVLASLPPERRQAELCIRIVDAAESAALNQRYRSKPGSTNVLSFPCDADVDGLALLGDLVICAPVVAQEADAQAKSEAAHWAHMVVHGVLHLLGYDHIGDHDAQIMESKERAILAGLGFPDPYIHQKDSEGASRH